MIDEVALILVQLQEICGRRGLWRTFRAVQAAQEMLGRDLDPTYAKDREKWIIKRVEES